MSIIGKYLFKNIIIKPFRTFLLVFCILCCSFVAALSLDITGNLENLMKSMLMQATGTADMIVSDSIGVEGAFEIPYENRQLPVYSTQGAIIERGDFYSYFHRTAYDIDTVDYELAYQMRLLPEKLSLQDGEAAVSEKLAQEAGWAVGDAVTLYDKENQAFEVQIVSVVSGVGMTNGANVLFLCEEDYGKLVPVARAGLVYVDILRDSDIREAGKFIEQTDYNAKADILLEKDEFQEMVRELSALFFMVFAVCFLLVIFVAISVSNRIVSERFSVVGTFRSLGISSACCTGLLLAENALYGLLGGLAGNVIYLMLRTAIWGSLIQVESTGLELQMEIPGANPLAFAAVLLLCMAMMCACPLREVIRTSKTAIRDIIFDNKDTAYQMNRVTLLLGCCCAAAAVGMFFLRGSPLAQILCFVLVIAAVAMVFPMLLKIIGEFLAKRFERLGMPIAQLAARECYARKSTVGSAGLCVTASMLAVVIFILVSTLGSVYDVETYDCDVIVLAGDRQENSRFSYIRELDGVTDTEVIFNRETKMQFDGKKSTSTVFGLNEGGFRLFSAIKGCPESLDADAFALDKSLAKKMGLQVGDQVDITFDADSYMPLTKTLRLAVLVDAFDYDTTGNVILLPMELYQDMYQAYPGQILVRCENPEETAAQIRKYSATTAADIMTAEENRAYWKEKESGMRGMLSAVIALGVGLTTIGMISNQLIGFQGRKRECAVLISTSMTRGKIAKMFLLESMIASGIALIVALPAALTTFIPFRALIETLGANVEVVYDLKLYALFLAALWVVFTLVALFPIGEMRKMNLAAQLKYE